MIVVVADDLSGAAELAGAALDHGLTAEVQRIFEPQTSAQVICVDTNSRLLPPAEASDRVRAMCRQIKKVSPDWVYKKTDSVLRGPVIAEIKSMLAELGQTDALLIPANPGKHRIIRDGQYYIHDCPLHETVFARDPEYPRHSSHVTKLLGLDVADAVGEGKVMVPDVCSTEDLRVQSSRLTPQQLPAGGVEFFEAILESLGHTPTSPPPQQSPVPVSPQKLFVCGSAAAWAHGRQEQCAAHHIPVETMPLSLFASNLDEAALASWAKRARNQLQERSVVMVAIGTVQQSLPFPPQELVERLAAMLEGLLSVTPIDQIFLEGGATASALLQRMQWNRLIAKPTIALHLASLQVADPPHTTLFIKPGSYTWPDSVWLPVPA